MDRMICFIGVPHVTPTAHDTSWLWNVAVVSRPSRGSFTGLRGNSEKLEKEYTVCCGDRFAGNLFAQAIAQTIDKPL